jgi:hypothetical protein
MFSLTLARPRGSGRPARDVKVQLFVLVTLVAQFADATEFSVHLFVQERLDLGLQDFDDPFVDAVTIGLAPGLGPVLPVWAIGESRAPE